MSLSNKSLALILVVSVIISAGGTLTALIRLDKLLILPVVTGQASTGAYGQANVTVTSQIALTAIYSFINFGGGFANGSTCRLNSTGAGSLGNCTTFRDANESIVVRNDGNSNLSINVSFDKTNASWIGGTNPGVWFAAWNNETGACPNGTRFYGPYNWTGLDRGTNPGHYRVCQGSANAGLLAFDDNKDAINIDIAVLVPQDADADPSTGDNLTITITGSDADTNPEA